MPTATRPAASSVGLWTSVPGTRTGPCTADTLLRNVPHDLVLDFLARYRFHDKSIECDTALLSQYIERRVKAHGGALRTWNVAVIGKPGGSPEGFYEFAPGIAVARVTRAKLEMTGHEAADIKTLMSPRDAGVDLDLTGSSEINEEELNACGGSRARTPACWPSTRSTVSPRPRVGGVSRSTPSTTSSASVWYSPAPRRGRQGGGYSADLKGVVSEQDELDAMDDAERAMLLEDGR